MKINRLAVELLSLYPTSFSTDFKNNKDAISKLNILSIRTRNQVAGHIARIKRNEGQKPIQKREPSTEDPKKRPRRTRQPRQ